MKKEVRGTIELYAMVRPFLWFRQPSDFLSFLGGTTCKDFAALKMLPHYAVVPRDLRVPGLSNTLHVRYKNARDQLIRVQ